MHRLCAVWSPEVYQTMEGTLRCVTAALRRGRTIKCGTSSSTLNAAWLHCAMATASGEALSLLNLSRSICNTMDMQVRILPGKGSNYRMQSGEVHAFVSPALCQGRRLHILPL